MKNIAIFAVAALLLAGVGAFAWNQVSNSQIENEASILSPVSDSVENITETVKDADITGQVEETVNDATQDISETIEGQIEESPIIAVDSPNPDTNEEVSEEIETEQITTTEALTATEVANHKNVNDCWTIVNDNVYDITEYIPSHPGGITILNACGTDGTDLFENQGGHSGSGHSPQASGILASYLLGALE